MYILPRNTDLRKSGLLPKQPYDQGQLNSCTAQAICAALYVAMQKVNPEKSFECSRLFLYYNGRYPPPINRGKTNCGFGLKGAPVKILDCLRTIKKAGICPESVWPYLEEQYNQKPPAAAYQIAAQHQHFQYQDLPAKLESLKACLVAGYPFVFGFMVFKSYQSEQVRKTGRIPYPEQFDKRIGAHALLAVGYDDTQEHFIIRNSFGAQWGENGYGYFPYSYMCNHLHFSFDHWAVYNNQLKKPI